MGQPPKINGGHWPASSAVALSRDARGMEPKPGAGGPMGEVPDHPERGDRVLHQPSQLLAVATTEAGWVEGKGQPLGKREPPAQARPSAAEVGTAKGDPSSRRPEKRRNLAMASSWTSRSCRPLGVSW